MSGPTVGLLVSWVWIGLILLVPVMLVSRLLLLVLVAWQLRIVATRGPGAVSWLGWLIFLLTFLSFRRATSTGTTSGAAAGAATGAAASYLVNGVPNHHTRVGRNGNRID